MNPPINRSISVRDRLSCCKGGFGRCVKCWHAARFFSLRCGSGRVDGQLVLPARTHALIAAFATV
jgi:hypothetical protein